MAYGIQIWDANGNLVLDTTDYTVKDVSTYVASSITAPTEVTGLNITPTTEVLVTNNVEATKPPPQITLDRVNKKLIIASRGDAFDVGVRLIEY